MKLIVGLGNPGSRYENTRHNVGFILVDKWVDDFKLSWQEDKKFKLELAKASELLFVKPKTFMNSSGSAVAGVLNYYNISAEDLLVVHDDVDIESGTSKLQFGAGSAGHHGVNDIIEHLKTKDFWRLRVGIGRPEHNKFEVHDFVLSSLNDKQLEAVRFINFPEF